ncbi:FAD binding domain-containing protein [Rutstroemia sp. NJR-2017a BVV2]|nr:FAD binding domain-containing protein [Rutstroemia sp. NJR-2017a BVV2]
MSSILDYKSPAYTGKAMKIGAGVQASEAQATANAEGCVVVEGDGPTVGIAGGYTQGGGTSPLASKFGLAADQVLEWEVVTGTGELLTATPSQHSDLYWALSGGGGGTYGVVLSMTVKLHRNMPTAGATLSLVEPSEKYWVWALNQSNIPYDFNAINLPEFQDAFATLNPEMNITELNIGGSIIPRSLVASNTSATSLVNAIKSILSNGGILAGVSMDASRVPTSPNAAHPSWRSSLFLAFLGTLYDRANTTANILGRKSVTQVLDPALDNLTPSPAAYLNEADFNHPDWQRVFYGENYAKLRAVKNKYDPEGVLGGQTAVGSESWAVGEDGRLCRTGF